MAIFTTMKDDIHHHISTSSSVRVGCIHSNLHSSAQLTSIRPIYLTHRSLFDHRGQPQSSLIHGLEATRAAVHPVNRKTDPEASDDKEISSISYKATNHLNKSTRSSINQSINKYSFCIKLIRHTYKRSLIQPPTYALVIITLTTH